MSDTKEKPRTSSDHWNALMFNELIGRFPMSFNANVKVLPTKTIKDRGKDAIRAAMQVMTYRHALMEKMLHDELAAEEDRFDKLREKKFHWWQFRKKAERDSEVSAKMHRIHGLRWAVVLLEQTNPPLKENGKN